MRRREFTKLALAGAVGTVAAPAVVQAQTTFNWKMTSFYGPNAAFYSTGPGSAKDLIKRIDDMSGGRIKIQFYGAGELIPAAEGFDAVSAGTVEMNYANAYFWTGKLFAGQYFTAVPFGLNFQGFNGWMYDGGGLQLWREAYDRFNLVPFLCGNTGVQMTGWFKKPIEKVDDLKGLKMRIPGLAGRVYQSLGVDVRLLPAGEIFPALERGVIDAAEFVGPYLDRQLGLQRAAKYYYTTGWHETATAKRADRQQGQMEFPAARPQGDRRERLRRLQRDQRGVVPEEQCRSDGRPDQEPGRHRAAAARPDRRGVARSQCQDHRGSCRQGPADQEGQRLLQAYMEKFTAMVGLQRGGLPQQDSQGLTWPPRSDWPTASTPSLMRSAA